MGLVHFHWVAGPMFVILPHKSPSPSAHATPAPPAPAPPAPPPAPTEDEHLTK